MVSISTDYTYSAEHEWVSAATDGVVTVGISEVATDALGDIVYVDLPTVGDTITAGETCGEVESTKSVSDLYAPVSGEVVEVNQAAIDDTASINSAPYTDGWLLRVRVSEAGPLLSAADYAAANGVEL